MPPDTDRQLVERVRAGEVNAFNFLVLRYQHRVAGLISRFVQNPQEIEDISQETFIKAYRALAQFRGDSSFYTWLYQIAVNTAKNHLASRNRRLMLASVDVDEAENAEAAPALRDIADPESEAEMENLRAVIDAAIEELPEELRTAFTLREFSGMSYEQITEVMDCPVGTVRSRIFRAREAIDRKIAELRGARE
ncbi:MAG: RNA polymerase sigma factor RpoE [Gammaproteobacteria bacterium]|nr:RNA polymerase sigma factor RpoE [Gammaproteobacteria bacterium]MCY4270175.1 RNA polymerase sigma factor RpoE [Gammaproteobacteria bacterium]MCY4295820.1 RNA polymerase sigma factor RpoE [Gammaproteobacteria bacterium]